jgi:hypothetical protein
VLRSSIVVCSGLHHLAVSAMHDDYACWFLLEILQGSGCRCVVTVQQFRHVFSFH